jgi:ribose transport system substrate-binding protein
VANKTKDNLLDRVGGFQEIVGQLAARAPKDGDEGGPSIEIVDFFVDDGDDQKCATLVRQALADHPDLACFVGLNARHGPVLMDVLKAEGQLGKVQVVAFDENPETLDGIASGDIFATVAQDPYLFGYEAVRMLAKLCRSDETEQPIGATTFSVNTETVRKDNLDAYKAKLKARQSDAGAAAKGNDAA